MKRIEFENFNETIYETLLSNRLRVFFIHKKGFSKTYVTLSAPVGSIHTGFLDENGEKRHVPKGVAHFLEHKIFEKDGADISRDFALEEAQINAFTEHHRTTYLFSATDHLVSNVRRLIRAFFYPDFTEAGIEKEKNIIKEELNMHLDDPYYKQYNTLINNMYESHPIKDDILGTKESIDAIDMASLKAMHEAYYQPEQAALVIVSGSEPEGLLSDLEAGVTLPAPSAKRPLPPDFGETEHVKKAHESKSLDVMMPSLLVGIKINTDHAQGPRASIEDKLGLSIFLDIALGKSSDIHKQLLDKELINDTFGIEMAYENDYAYVLLGTETEDPHKTLEALHNIFNVLPTIEISDEEFRRARKQMLGNFIHGLDSLESLSYHFTQYIQQDIYYYDVLEIATTLSKEAVTAHRHRIGKNHISSVIVEAKQK